MALETATYIHQLNAANPVSGDGLGQADDHLRLIKATLQATFPNLTGPVTSTQAILSAPVPTGCILLWSGSVASIPSGWALCNGSNGTPDLRDRFVLGAGTTAPLTTGGALSKVTTSAADHTHTGTTASSGAHTHGGATGGTALTEAQMPSHTHAAANGAGFATAGTGWGVSTGGQLNVGGTSLTSTGGGQAHSHSISSDGGHTHSFTTAAGGSHNHTISDIRPPFMALCYIMKL